MCNVLAPLCFFLKKNWRLKKNHVMKSRFLSIFPVFRAPSIKSHKMAKNRKVPNSGHFAHFSPKFPVFDRPVFAL